MLLNWIRGGEGHDTHERLRERKEYVIRLQFSRAYADLVDTEMFAYTPFCLF